MRVKPADCGPLAALTPLASSGHMEGVEELCIDGMGLFMRWGHGYSSSLCTYCQTFIVIAT